MRFLGLVLGLFLSVSAFADSYVGVGITIQKDKDDFHITDLLENGPAQRAGVLVGDQLAAVDNKETHGQKLSDVASWIRGEAGTPVTLLLVNEKVGKRELSVVREVIEIKCVLEGSYSLQFRGGSFASLTGWVGRDHVNLSGSERSISGYVNGQYLHLDVNSNSPGSDYVSITGWFRNAHINWSGYSNNISGYQNCIQ